MCVPALRCKVELSLACAREREMEGGRDGGRGGGREEEDRERERERGSLY